MSAYKSVLATAAFWYATGERALKTTAQTAVLAIGTDYFSVIEVDWEGVLWFGLGGGVLSILTSIASIPIGADKTSPSMVPTPADSAARHPSGG